MSSGEAEHEVDGDARIARTELQPIHFGRVAKHLNLLKQFGWKPRPTWAPAFWRANT